jgi:hypothetical protein
VKLVKIIFAHQNDAGLVVFVSPASVADVSEREVKVFASNANPIAHSFIHTLLSRKRVLEDGSFISSLVLLVLTRIHLILVNVWLILGLFVNLSQKMLWLAVEVLLRLLLKTAIALGPSVEVVVLTITADPAPIREVEHLIFVLLFWLLLALRLGILPSALRLA